LLLLQVWTLLLLLLQLQVWKKLWR